MQCGDNKLEKEKNQLLQFNYTLIPLLYYVNTAQQDSELFFKYF